MLPPIAPTAPARSSQTAREPVAADISASANVEAEHEPVLPASTAKPGLDRLTTLALSGQLAGGRGVLNVTDMIGSLLGMERQPNESLGDYSDRLLQALKSLSPSAQNSLQQALAQWMRSMALSFLVQALRNPDGPEATKLAAQLETLAMDKQGAQRQMSAGYSESQEIDAVPASPRPSVQPRPANDVDPVGQPRSNRFGQIIEQVPSGLRALLRSATSSGERAQSAPLTSTPANPSGLGWKPEISDRSSSDQAQPNADAAFGPRQLVASASGALSNLATITNAGGEDNDFSPPSRTNVASNSQPPEGEAGRGAGHANLPEADIDEKIYRQVLADGENPRRERGSGSGPNGAERFDVATRGSDPQTTKQLIIAGLSLDAPDPAIPGETAAGKPERTLAAAALPALGTDEIEAGEPNRTASASKISMDGKPAHHNQDAKTAAEIIPQPVVAHLSLTAALLRDESAMAGLAQALVQMRSILPPAALPAHVLYPPDSRDEDDEEVRVTAVEAEDEDRHRKRQDRGQQDRGHDHQHDRGRDEQDKAAPATDGASDEASSTAPEPADFYRRLGGW